VSASEEEAGGGQPVRPVAARRPVNGGGRNRLLIAGGVVVAFGLFGVISWYAYREARDLLRGEPRLVRAPAEPYRTKPEDPGGLPVLNESAPIVTVLEGREEPLETERILPVEEPPARSAREILPPEEPATGAAPPASPATGTAASDTPPPPPTAARETPQPLLPGTAGGIATGETELPMPERLLAEELQEMTVEPGIAAIEPAAGEVAGREEASESPVPPAFREEAEAEAAAPVVAARPRREPAPAPGTAPTRLFRIQLAALSDEAAASRAWDRFRRRYGELLAGLEPVVRPATSGGRTLYRVQAGSFASREEARARCTRIRQAGGDCFVVGPVR